MDLHATLRRALVIFWMPGFGLGKLTRAMAIARHLETKHWIYTSATSYNKLIGRRQGFRVRNCCKGAIEDIATMNPAIIVTDAQPYAKNRMLASIPCKHVFIARKCNGGYQRPSGFDAVIDPQDRYILIRDKSEWSLEKGRRALGQDEPVLAFHAGMNQAERDYIFLEGERIAKNLGKRLVCMEPERFFPVCELFPAAGHIVCAAGYNSFAETQCWGGPVTYVLMKRAFDDQEARLSEGPKHFDGAKKAAALIHKLILEG
jgi:hypothetical protein